DSLGETRTLRTGVCEFVVERSDECRIGWRHDIRSRDRWQKARRERWNRSRLTDRALDDEASFGAAIVCTALEPAGQRRGHFAMRAVDVVVHEGLEHRQIGN